MAETVLETLVIKVDSDTSGADSGLTALQKTLSKFKGAANTGSSGTKKLTASFSSFTSKVRSATSVFRMASDTMGAWFNKSNDYVEALNLFNVAMGDATEQALEYARTVERIMGIDITEWLSYQGAFNQLAEGYGIASESANNMSKNLTQLAYDLSSLWNTDVETAFQKLQSGMSGQIKGLKVWGINVSVAQLRETALAHGIDLATSKMTEAQKATLRYITIMEQTSTAQRDLARTIATPANALRILQAQWIQCQRAMGQVVNVIAVKVIPWFQALIQILKEAAQSLANFLGYELPDIDYSGVIGGGVDASDNLTDSLGEAVDNAKELKKSLLGIDELNVMTDNSSASAGAAGLGGGYDPTFGMDLGAYDYDFLSNIKMPDLEPMKEKLKKILEIIGLIATGITGWKLGSFIADLLTANAKATTLRETIALIGKKAGLTIGITSAITGIALEIKGIKEAVTEGLDGINFGEIIGGGGMIAGGGALIGQFFGSAILGGAIGGIVAGIPAFVVGVYDAIKNGIDILSALLVGAGATAAGAGIGAIIGAIIGAGAGPIGAGIGALIGLAVGLFTDFCIWFWQKFDEIKQVFLSLPDWVQGLLVVGNIIISMQSPLVMLMNYITGVITIIKEWNNIVEGIKDIPNKLKNVPKELRKGFDNLWQLIQDYDWSGLGNNIGQWLGSAVKAAITFVIEVIPYWFTEVWNSITAALNTFITVTLPNFFMVTIPKAFNAVIDFFKKLPETLWNAIKSGWNWLVDIGKSIVDGIWEGLQTVWQAIKDFVSGFVQGFKDALGIHSPSTVFAEIGGYLIEGLFNGLTAGWEAIKTWFSGAVEWIFQNFVAPIKNAVSNVWESVKPGASVAWEWFSDTASSVGKTLSKAENAIADGAKSVGKWFSSLFKADGAYGIPTGQMFIAREAGAEMVGSIGRKTTVANNDQIVEGIAGGVADANIEQNAILREQNALLRKLLEKDTNVTTVVSTGDVIDGFRRKNRRDGKTTVPVGV